jgi:6-phosphogluconolactonase
MRTSDDFHRIDVADPAALALAAAERLMTRLDANRGRIAICLTGGSSPKQLYQMLATDSFSKRIPWNRVHWFIGDERFVPNDHPLNNMRMAREIFLDRLAPASHVHPIPTDAANPGESAHRYAETLQSFYGGPHLDPARPLFDVVLMGVGPDGHTASLFPNDPALLEAKSWAVGVAKAPVEPFVPRVTLTFPVLGSSREMLFEVAGAEKHAIVMRLLAGEDLPANRARSVNETILLVDQAALSGEKRDR